MLDRRVGAAADSGSSRLFLSIRPYPGRFRDRCKHFSGQSEVGNRFSDFRRPHRTFQNVPVCTFSYRCVKRSGLGNFYLHWFVKKGIEKYRLCDILRVQKNKESRVGDQALSAGWTGSCQSDESKERLCADPSAVHGPHPAASEKIIGI